MARYEELLKKFKETPDSMTEEELSELMRVAQGGEEEKEEKPKPEPSKERPRAVLPDGTVIEADSYDELIRRLSAVQQEKKEDTPPAPPAQPPKFDMKTFSERFLQDPEDGLEYLETTKYGFPVRKTIPTLLAVTKTLVDKVQEMEAERFVDKHPDYEPSPENQRILEGILRSRGWTFSYKSLSDAYKIAKADGLIKPKKGDDEQETREPFKPPRAPNKPSAAAKVDPNSLTDEQLEKILVDAGVIRQKVLSR